MDDVPVVSENSLDGAAAATRVTITPFKHITTPGTESKYDLQSTLTESTRITEGTNDVHLRKNPANPFVNGYILLTYIFHQIPANC